MTKVLFSNPPWWVEAEDGQIRCGVRAGSRWPFTMQTNARPDKPVAGEYLPAPFFMQYAAGYAAGKTDARVVIRDSLARRESYATYLNYIHATQPDIIVIESATPSWEHDLHVAKLATQAHPGAHIVITGTITSTHAKEIAALGYSAIKGEYEKGIVRVINGERGVFEHEMLTEAEMNAAPYPMVDEEYALAYWDSCPTGQQYPHLQLWASRGCVYKCCFCAWPAVMTGNDPDGLGKRSVRFYSEQYLEGYIRHRLAINTGIKSIYFDGDTENLGDKQTLAICAVMKRIGLPWSAMCRADTVKLETWQAMKDAGCYGVKIGMESGSQHVIDKIVNKRLNLADIEDRILPYMKQVGLHVHTTWTVGLPGETVEQGAMTTAMIRRLYDKGLTQTHQLSGTATISGTPLDAISRGEHLTAYPGADNRNFLITGDGQAKIETLAKGGLLK
jgi:radical SAM superfamily enzyme YgiQ (UPF0313 family)